MLGHLNSVLIQFKSQISGIDVTYSYASYPICMQHILLREVRILRAKFHVNKSYIPDTLVHGVVGYETRREVACGHDILTTYHVLSYSMRTWFKSHTQPCLFKASFSKNTEAIYLLIASRRRYTKANLKPLCNGTVLSHSASDQGN